MSLVLTAAGRHEEALRHAEQALRLDPLAPHWYFRQMGAAYSWVGQHEEAITALKKALDRAPNDILTHVRLASAYSLAGRMDEARAEAEEVLKINPKFSIENYAKTFSFQNKADIDLITDALRKAGLPETPPLPLPDKPSIAVLPFVNMSDDPKQEYFSDGITEEIITALSKTPKLFVIARNSSFTYKGKPVKVQQVSRDLGVRYVLEGSVRKSGEKVRITAQLVDATTGNHLWAERYDRDLKDIFAIQDEITMKVIEALQVNLTEGEHARIMGKGTDNLEAYLLLLQAVDQNMRMTKDANILGRQLAEQTIALDPNYAAAYRVLAHTYWVELPLGATKDPRRSLARAMELAQKSIALDNSSGMAHSLLGWLYTIMRQHDKGVSECELGVELEPNSAPTNLFLAMVLRFSGRHEEAIAMHHKAIRLDPIPASIYYHTLSLTYSLAGRYEEAVTEAKKSIRLEPNSMIPHIYLAIAYNQTGREDEARLEAKEVLRINPKFSLEFWAKNLPFKHEADKDMVIGALRKAGLPD